MNKTLKLQGLYLAEIEKQCQKISQRELPELWEKVHSISCGKLGLLLALKRGANPDLAAIASSVHDYGRIITGKQANHAQEGYEPLKKWLKGTSLFSSEEIGLIATAAKNHSNKDIIGNSLEEIVKDADVLDCYQYGLPIERTEQQERLRKILAEINLNL